MHIKIIHYYRYHQTNKFHNSIFQFIFVTSENLRRQFSFWISLSCLFVELIIIKSANYSSMITGNIPTLKIPPTQVPYENKRNWCTVQHILLRTNCICVHCSGNTPLQMVLYTFGSDAMQFIVGQNSIPQLCRASASTTKQQDMTNWDGKITDNIAVEFCLSILSYSLSLQP